MFYERQRAGHITGVIKNHNYDGANDRRKQFYRGSILPEILHTGWLVGNSSTSIKVLRFPPPYTWGWVDTYRPSCIQDYRIGQKHF